MHTILEYLAYPMMVSLVGALLFVASAMLVVTKEGAKRLADKSRKIADHAAKQVVRNFEPSAARLSRRRK